MTRANVICCIDTPCLVYTCMILSICSNLQWLFISQTNPCNLFRVVATEECAVRVRHEHLYRRMPDLQIMESMRIYTNLAEKAIAAQELKCLALQAELHLCQANLIEAQERLIRQTKVKRVSQFELERLPSGGTRKIMVAGILAKCVECTAITGCDSSQGCCEVVSDGETNGFVLAKCDTDKEFRVFEHQTNDDEIVYEVRLSKTGPCPSPEG